MNDTWHTRSERRPKRHRRRPCLHCDDGTRGEHYLCSEERPCQDCVDDALTAAENIASGYGPHGEDTGADGGDDDFDYGPDRGYGDY